VKDKGAVKVRLEELNGEGDKEDLEIEIYQAGRKEVTEWIRDNWHHIDRDMWIKQLDIWGVYD